MVIYITSEENKNLLARMSERYEWELLTEVMEKGSLNTFITDKIQVIHNIRYLVIERSCVKENEQQMRDLLETILTIWSPKIILLEEILQDDDGEFQKVMYRDNITSLYKYQDDLEENIEYLLKGEKIPAENVYSGTWIGVMSSNSGAGCTHVAIDLANFIANQGQSVCYVEANESGDLCAMAQFYELEQIGDNHYRKNDIDYWHQMIDPEKKYAVLDIGKYNAAKMEMFNQCKIKILVTDGKPYRMADALNVLRYVKDDSTRLWLNYLQEEEFQKISELYLSSIFNPIGRVDWHKKMFLGEDSLYQEAMKGYINISPKKQSRFTFLLKPELVQIKRERLQFPKVVKGILEHDVKEAENVLPEDDYVDDSISEELDISDQELCNVEEEEQSEKIVEEDSMEQGEPAEQSSIDPFVAEIDVEKDSVFDDLEQEVIVIEPAKIVQQSSIPIRSALKMLLLVVGVGAIGIGLLHIKDNVPGSIFNNQEAHQETTELVDEDLNINSDIKISVLEVEGADGYEVSYSTDKEFSKDRTVIVEVQTADKAVESLSAGKTYYVRVRAFKFNEDGTKVYGEYTDVQKIKT